jgi:hypothetical protein
MQASVWSILAFFVLAATLFVLAPGATVDVSANSTNATQAVDSVADPLTSTVLGVGFMAAVGVFLAGFLGGEAF